MRERKILRWAILAGALITVGVFAAAEPEGTTRLVSVQNLPADIDTCSSFDAPGLDAVAPADTPREQHLRDRQLSESGQGAEIAKIPAPLGARAGATLALAPLHKEVIVATAAGNSILTFLVPELYDEHPAPQKTLSSQGQ